MPKLNHIEKMNKAPYKDTKNIGEEFRIKIKTKGIDFSIYYLAQYTQNIILTCVHLKLSERVHLLPVQCFHDPVWICTCLCISVWTSDSQMCHSHTGEA